MLYLEEQQVATGRLPSRHIPNTALPPCQIILEALNRRQRHLLPSEVLLEPLGTAPLPKRRIWLCWWTACQSGLEWLSEGKKRNTRTVCEPAAGRSERMDVRSHGRLLCRIHLPPNSCAAVHIKSFESPFSSHFSAFFEMRHGYISPWDWTKSQQIYATMIQLNCLTIRRRESL